MPANLAIGRARLALIIGAFVVSACGASTPSATPDVATLAPTVAPVVTLPPPTPSPVPTLVPTPVPSPTAIPEIDPAVNLTIAAPYVLAPLDEALEELLVSSMKDSMGGLADIFHIGVRSAAKDGKTVAYVIVMDFPDLPASELSMLNGAADGAAGKGGVEKKKILDHPVRIVQTSGLFAALAFVDGNLVFSMAETKSGAVGVITALIKASP